MSQRYKILYIRCVPAARNVFLVLFWAGSENLHAPGRYSIRVDAEASKIFGINMSVQFATTEVEQGYATHISTLMEYFADADYIYSIDEDLSLTGCPVTYYPLTPTPGYF